MPVPWEVVMSDFDNGLREAMKAAMVIFVAVVFGPWIVMLIAAWLLEPRTGSWGAWPHIIGLGWATLLVAFLAYGWFRRT